MINKNACKYKHKWETNWDNPMGLYMTPTGRKDQHIAVRCEKCGKTGWRNCRTNAILNR